MFGSAVDSSTGLFPTPVEQTVLQMGKAGFDSTQLSWWSHLTPWDEAKQATWQVIHPKGTQKAHSRPWAALHSQAGELLLAMLPATSMCRLVSFSLTTRARSAMWASRVVACGRAWGKRVISWKPRSLLVPGTLHQPASWTLQIHSSLIG